jgi:hypothetical protein
VSLSQPNDASRYGIRRRCPSVISSLCRLAVFVGFTTLLTSCATETDPVKAELYPETQQPHFKTCAARVGGTYRERELQKHKIIDIYLEPAPDEGPMTEECIVRE